MNAELLWWIGFNLFVLAMLALDLTVFHRRAHVVRMKEALFWSGVWIGLALISNLGLWQGWFGSYPEAERSKAALEFLAGFVIEKSLSVDNLFVFAVIFGYFQTPAEQQHRVLFWGILGALVLRALFIWAGITLVRMFDWVLYLFGAVLLVSGIRMLRSPSPTIDPSRNPFLRLISRLVPLAPGYYGGKFMIQNEGRIYLTPLFVVLGVTVWTDLVFALDSIPAILAITDDPFIVYTSNVFALLGLRALYFALNEILNMFRYLHYGLSAVLIFVGLKLIGTDLFHISTPISLAVVSLLIALAMFLSWWKPSRD